MSVHNQVLIRAISGVGVDNGERARFRSVALIFERQPSVKSTTVLFYTGGTRRRAARPAPSSEHARTTPVADGVGHDNPSFVAARLHIPESELNTLQLLPVPNGTIDLQYAPSPPNTWVAQGFSVSAAGDVDVERFRGVGVGRQ